MGNRTPIRLNLADAVEDLAPKPPPCFHNRSEWVSYLQSAAAAQNQRDEHKVIVITPNGEPLFNRQFPFCQDCAPEHQESMAKKGLCVPTFLSGPSGPAANTKRARRLQTVKKGGSIPCSSSPPAATSSKEPSKPFAASSPASDPPRPERSKPTQMSLPLADPLRPKQGALWSVFAKWAK